jgi:hypothetical protein
MPSIDNRYIMLYQDSVIEWLSGWSNGTYMTLDETTPGMVDQLERARGTLDLKWYSFRRGRAGKLEFLMALRDWQAVHDKIIETSHAQKTLLRMPWRFIECPC